MLNKFLKIYFWWDISIISGSFLKTKLVPAKSRKLWVIKTKKIWMIENWLKDIFKWFHAVVYHFWFSSEAVKQKSFQKIDIFFSWNIFFTLIYSYVPYKDFLSHPFVCVWSRDKNPLFSTKFQNCQKFENPNFEQRQSSVWKYFYDVLFDSA